MHILLQRKRQATELKQEHLELIGGIIASTVANMSGKISKKQLAASDYMPSFQSRKAKRDREMPKDLIAQNIRCFLKAQMDARTPK